jgi:hypothetical protein
MLHLLTILCYCVYHNGMKMKQWHIHEEHDAHEENIILQSCHQSALQRSLTLSIKMSISVHWMLYCNLNNQPFKTEIMHQLNEQDKACHTVCKQLLNLLQKIQAYWMHSWCQMRHISIQQVIYKNIFNTRIKTLPANYQHPLHSLAYTWQCGVQYFPSALCPCFFENDTE